MIGLILIMVKEYQYTNIREVLASLKEHPLLEDLTLERVIRYTITFIGKMGMPRLYQDKQEVVEINDYRGLLPCDLVSIIQVRDKCHGLCLRAMTDNFSPNETGREELSFKTQGRVIYTSFRNGEVEVAYKSIPVDEDGFPQLIDNPVFIAALEAYIKLKCFTILFDMNKISQNVLQNTQQEYAFLAGQCQSEFTIPSISEMEAISRSWNTMIPRVTEFDDGFKNLGNREYIRRH